MSQIVAFLFFIKQKIPGYLCILYFSFFLYFPIKKVKINPIIKPPQKIVLIISGFKDSLILSAKISITDTEDNAKQAILIAKNILYTFVVNKNLLQTYMYSYLLSKVLDRALNEVPLLYETFTIPLPPGRLYFLRLKKTP